MAKRTCFMHAFVILNSPGLPPPFLHTVTTQELDGGKGAIENLQYSSQTMVPVCTALIHVCNKCGLACNCMSCS